MVGVVGAATVLVGLLAAGAHARHSMFIDSDSPFFLAVARHPFGSGGIPGNPLLHGVAYRYGRILFPLTAWLAALGRSRSIAAAMVGVYVVSFGACVAFAAEHLRRIGRHPNLALCIFALPFSVLQFMRPVIISEPMAAALVLLVFLYERDLRRRAMYVAAAALILTREPMALALLPMMWTGWKERRFAAAREWALVILPYALWLVWVRVRVGQFPFLDPSRSRRGALAAPFAGYLRTIQLGASGTHQFAVVVGVLTIVVAVAIALRGNWRYPLTHGALALALIVPCLGVYTFKWPAEALRVMMPAQTLLLIAALDRGARRATASATDTDARASLSHF